MRVATRETWCANLEFHDTFVRKTYKPEHWEQFLRDAYFQPRVSEAYASGEREITMPRYGVRPTDLPARAMGDLLAELVTAGVQHNDITPDNLLWNRGQLVLVDFAWATPLGIQPPTHWPKNLGSRYRAGPGWHFSDAVSLEKVFNASM